MTIKIGNLVRYKDRKILLGTVMETTKDYYNETWVKVALTPEQQNRHPYGKEMNVHVDELELFE